MDGDRIVLQSLAGVGRSGGKVLVRPKSFRMSTGRVQEWYAVATAWGQSSSEEVRRRGAKAEGGRSWSSGGEDGDVLSEVARASQELAHTANGEFSSCRVSTAESRLL